MEKEGEESYFGRSAEQSQSFFTDRNYGYSSEAHQNHIQRTVRSQNYTVGFNDEMHPCSKSYNYDMARMACGGGNGCGGGFPPSPLPSPPLSPRLYLKIGSPKLEFQKLEFLSSDDIRKKNEEAKIKDLSIQLKNHPVKILKYCFKENVSTYCYLKLIVKNLDVDIPLDVVKYVGSFMVINLSGADLSYADLSFQNLMGVNLSEAKYYRADIDGAEMKKKDRIKAKEDGATIRFDFFIDIDEDLYEPIKYNFNSNDLEKKHSKIDLNSLVYQPRVLAPYVFPPFVLAPFVMPPPIAHNYNFADFVLPINEVVHQEVEEAQQNQ